MRDCASNSARLRNNLGEVIGTNAGNSGSELQTLAASAQPSQADLASLSATIDELQSVIAERDQELQAARRLNADLTRQLNQSVSFRNLSDPRPT